MNKIFHFLQPDLMIESLSQLSFEKLEKRKIKLLFCDIDNTLLSLKTSTSTKDINIFLKMAKEKEIKIILVSNNFEKRVKSIADSFDLPFNSFSCKPFPFSFQKLMKKYGVTKEECAAVGDQIFTDILGAKLLKIYAIYCKPINKEDRILTKLLRIIERRILNDREKM